VVLTTVKNNDGRGLGPRTAWERRNGLFVAVDEFDWDAYDQGAWKPRETKVKPEHLRELFAHGGIWLDKSDSVRQLQPIAKVGRTAAYDALKTVGGRYSEMLRQRDDGKIGLTADEGDAEATLPV